MNQHIGKYVQLLFELKNSIDMIQNVLDDLQYYRKVIIEYDESKRVESESIGKVAALIGENQKLIAKITSLENIVFQRNQEKKELQCRIDELERQTSG